MIGIYICLKCKALIYTDYSEDRCFNCKSKIKDLYRDPSISPFYDQFKYKFNYASYINCKIAGSLRSRILQAVKSQNTFKYYKTFDLLGCSISQFRKYMFEKFTEGMTWANHGEWEIDHIRPCASYRLINPVEQKRCFHHTNLQPLWTNDNRRKSSKYKGFKYFYQKPPKKIYDPEYL